MFANAFEYITYYGLFYIAHLDICLKSPSRAKSLGDVQKVNHMINSNKAIL